MPIDPQTKQFIIDHEQDDIRQLALRSKKYAGIDMPIAIKQIAARQIIRKKVPQWYQINEIIYPQHLSIEQCSSQLTAEYKASLCSGNLLVDLTGGLGIDFSFMSRKTEHAIYVDFQNELVELAKHNFKTLGLDNVQIENSDGVDFLEKLEQMADVIYIDPARRSSVGRKTVLIEDCTPNLIEIDDRLNTKSHKCIIKLSPMLDISQALNSLSNVVSVHVISIANECKELLLVKEKTPMQLTINCINIKTNGAKEEFSFSLNQENAAVVSYADWVAHYLYEPNSSIMKAGGYKSIASHYHLKKLHPNSHLYTCDKFIEDFPGRVFIAKQVLSLNKKELKTHLSSITQANITVRNFPLSVDEIRKQTRLKDGGTDYIFATTLFNEKKVLILCERIKSNANLQKSK